MVIAYMRKYDTPPVCVYMRIWCGYALYVIKALYDTFMCVIYAYFLDVKV